MQYVNADVDGGVCDDDDDDDDEDDHHHHYHTNQIYHDHLEHH